jgi:CRP-like cAMP-binding protein
MKWSPATPITTSTPSAFPAFAPIVSDAFEYLKGIPDGTTIESGQIVLEQSQHPPSVCLLRQGLVKLVHRTSEGRETLLGLRAAGWYAGAVPALMHSPCIYSVETVTPCIFSKIPAEEFAAKLRQNARMMRHFMNTLCNELIAQSAEAQVKVGSAEQRLAQFMSERNVQYPQLKTLDTLPLLKQMELAQLLAITPEHLSRLLHKTGSVRPSENTHGSLTF